MNFLLFLLQMTDSYFYIIKTMDKNPKPLDHFVIKSTLVDAHITIILQVYDSPDKATLKKLFGNTFNEDSLPEDVKKNFQDIENVHSILNQSPQKCRVDCETGHITLLYQIKFPNGNKFMLEGNLVLNRKEIQTKEFSKSSLEVQKRMRKMQEDIKKIQQFCYKDAKAKQENITKISKDLVEDCKDLRLKIEQIKQENQKIQNKNSELEKKQNQLKSNSQKGLSGDIIQVFDMKLEDMKLGFTDKLQKQAEKIQDLEQAQTRNKRTIDKVSQENLELKKTIKTLQEKIAIIVERLIASEQKLDITEQQNKKMNKKISDHGTKIEQIKIAQSSPKKQSPTVNQSKYSQGSNNNFKVNPLDLFFADLQSPKSSERLSDQTFSLQPMQIHSDSAYSRQFVFNGKAIMYNGVSEQHTILVGALNISVQRVSYLTILKSKRNEVAFGFIDEKNIKDRNPVKKNSIMMSASNGGLYDNGIFISADAAGFKQGEKVKMRVNPVQGFVEYSIAGSVAYKHRNQKLRDQSISWLPFIRLCDKGDTVKWTLQ